MGGGVCGNKEVDVNETCKVNFTGFSEGLDVERRERDAKPPSVSSQHNLVTGLLLLEEKSTGTEQVWWAVRKRVKFMVGIMSLHVQTKTSVDFE